LPRKAGEKSLPQGNSSRIEDSPWLGPRRILGEIPVTEDEARPDDPTGTGHASFNVEVPANTPIQVQLLDEQGVVLRSCRWVWARNHQSQGCIGCHEDGELTPPNYQPAALWKSSVRIDPPVAEREAVGFRRQVMPLVAKKCLSCHDQAGSPPVLTPRGAAADPVSDALAMQVYRVLLAGVGEKGEIRGKYVHPGQARTSPLYWHVAGRNTSRPWDGAGAKQAAKPIAGSREPLTDAERKVFAKWIDLGAAWDCDSDEGPAALTSGHGKPSER
jgi:hypothetical protein